MKRLLVWMIAHDEQVWHVLVQVMLLCLQVQVYCVGRTLSTIVSFLCQGQELKK